MQTVLERNQEDREDVVDELGNDNIPFVYHVNSYGTDFSAKGLVELIRDGGIDFPDFQRGYVWKQDQASKFIESLLLGLPVPSVFLTREPLPVRRGSLSKPKSRGVSRPLLVIDGQQRLLTLERFYRGRFGDDDSAPMFALTGLGKKSEYEGETYKTLSPDGKLTLDLATIHATVVNQDSPEDGSSSIFLLFERLNSGGTILQSQEIRSAIYQGSYNKLLRKLSGNPEWQTIYSMKPRNLRDQELILRFFALYFERGPYREPMKQFLNEHMESHAELSDEEQEKFTRVFEDAVHFIYSCLKNRAFKRPKGPLNAAIYDAVMFGVAKRLQRGPIVDCQAFKKKYVELLADDRFSDAVKNGTGDVTRVKTRIDLAVTAFSEVQ
jgi:Protein of unknown function DUF262